jgi:K+-transporting ATPase KdpF subunit
MRTRTPAGGCSGMIDNLIGLVLGLASLVYLSYAMLRPEKF